MRDLSDMLEEAGGAVAQAPSATSEVVSSPSSTRDGGSQVLTIVAPVPDTVNAAALSASGLVSGAEATGGSAPSLALPHGLSTKCVAPSEIIDQVTAGIVGGIFEKIIEADYCTKMGCRPFATDFFDVGGWAAPYIAFLAAHNPGVNVPLLAAQVGLSGGVLIPDILTDAPPRQEYYEIKPNSVDGRPAGRGKLAAIDAFMSFNSLPYGRGRAYTPTPTIPLPGVGALVLATLNPPALAACGPPDIALEVKRLAPGLLVYRICIAADWPCLLAVVTLEALVAAVIAAIIILGPVLIPAWGPVLIPIAM